MATMQIHIPEIPAHQQQEINTLRRNALLERCATELEAAYLECDTLSLLHGAARLRAMKLPLPADPQ